jgi:hypothetical protein
VMCEAAGRYCRGGLTPTPLLPQAPSLHHLAVRVSGRCARQVAEQLDEFRMVGRRDACDLRIRMGGGVRPAKTGGAEDTGGG